MRCDCSSHKRFHSDQAQKRRENSERSLCRWLGLLFVLLFLSLGSLQQTVQVYAGIPLAVTGGVFVLVLRRLFSAPTIVLLTCLLGAGCASNREDKSLSQASPPVTVLSDSIEPLRQQFNADKDKLRVLALLSPT